MMMECNRNYFIFGFIMEIYLEKGFKGFTLPMDTDKGEGSREGSGGHPTSPVCL